MNFKRIISVCVSLVLTLCYVPRYKADEEIADVNAPSYILMEQSTGKVLCGKNFHEVRPAASVMKIITLLISIELLDSGKISEGDIVNISDKAAETQGANVWLKSGETVSVGDLIKAVAMVSANDASVALAEYIGGAEGKFLSMMNDRAKELGMKDTIFKDCIGSDEDGNVTSAYDIALMSRELMEHKTILPYISTWIDHLRDGQTQIVNTNKIIKTYQGAMGIKTGTSEKAGSCISASAERDGMNLIAVILGGANSKDRFKDAFSLLDYGFSRYVMVEPKEPEELLNKIKVKNGMLGEVGLISQVEGQFVIPKGKEKEVLCEVKLTDEITAPFECGTSVGSIIYKYVDETLAEYDIVTEKGDKEREFKLVFQELIMSFFAF